MTLREKIALFAVLPLVLALCAIALTVRHHAISLSQQQREVIKPAYLAMKDAELKNYVEFAMRTIAHLHESGRTDAEAREEARAILEKMDDGRDNYLFLYSLDGTLLAHPKQIESVGENMWNFQDPAGKFLIQDLIRVARSGGGFEDYVWPKYSTGSLDPKPKRAYVVEVPGWGWMLGTGVYLDDIDDALSEIDSRVSRNIEDTMLWIAGIAFLAMVVIFLGLLRNIRERTVLDDRLSEANSNLMALTQRLIDARAEEETRIKYLHGGIQSMLTAIKVNIEAALRALPQTPQLIKESASFRSAAKQLGGVLGDLRKIMKGTSIIDPNLSLSDQLNELTLAMSTVATPIEFAAVGEIKYLPLEVNEALFMSAKTALENIIKHAGASRASVLLEGTTSCVKMEIRDNGKGFDVELVYNNPNSSIGLRSMKDDLKVVGGKLAVTSSPSDGTRLVATVPYP
ncbi:two-component system, NarL family, sensor kinase [Nitrosospira sp. Nl5]|uniref:cache domain-containing protein n=1 Tax=Nitrosospira sp. Nl5 TaxID=200120 RepID=UPI000886D26B|nr:cache domain-containing protein [Nitrosospira sp. Nl5]SCX88342.1 two-component system, NarL family, sensor kinase [Nitrosospira sp. Nl5]